MRSRNVIAIMLLATSVFAQKTDARDLRMPVCEFALEKPAPLITAVGEVGLHVDSDYVSFGIDLTLEGPEPTVTLRVNSGENLNEALLQIVDQLPGYTFEPVSEHLVIVYKAGSQSDPQNVLNVRIAKFQVSNVPPLTILGNPARFMPELRARLEEPSGHPSCGVIGPGLGAIGPGITLTLQNLTVCEILNRVAEASSTLAVESDSPSVVPLGWIHIVHVSTRESKKVHEWRFYSATPKSWRRPK